MFKSYCISLPESLVKVIDEVKKTRMDPSRSHTIRLLLLKALADLDYLSIKERKALDFLEAVH